MSHVVMLCPSCNAPARANPSGRVARYTCPSCRETTLMSELVAEKRFTHILGGGSPEVFLGTIRGATSLGDQNDGTNVNVSDDGSSGLEEQNIATYSIATDIAAALAITRIRFSIRAKYTFDGAGPTTPSIAPSWRIGASGTIASGSLVGMGAAEDTPIDISTGDITTDPTGAPWTLANVNNLRLMGIASTFPGSGNATNIFLLEVWAEVWGRA